MLSRRTSLELGVGRHTLILLYAPFEVVTRVQLDGELRFRDVVFPEGTVVDHRYLFDGTRLSYLYGVFWRCLRVDLGASFQIRNADVAFTAVDGTLHAAEDDIGLVFALKTRVAWVPPAGLWGSMEADGFSTFGAFGVQGAIYDVALTLGIPVADPVDLILRLRLLGGSADVPKRDLENWANFFAATAGLRLKVVLLFLLFARPAAAQPASVESTGADSFEQVDAIRRNSLRTRRSLLTAVLVGGIVSVVGGGLLLIPDADDQAWRYAGINTAAFGVANTIIGAIALVGISAEERFELAPRAGETAEQRANRLLQHAIADERRESVGHAINLGLDIGYAGIGGTAILASQLGVDHPDRWLASGVAIAIQSVFLIVVDLWGLEASGSALRALLDRRVDGD